MTLDVTFDLCLDIDTQLHFLFLAKKTFKTVKGILYTDQSFKRMDGASEATHPDSLPQTVISDMTLTLHKKNDSSGLHISGASLIRRTSTSYLT